jgi:hypothetical protein
MPITGGGSTATMKASWIAESRLFSSAWIAGADWCGSLARFWKESSTRNSAPELGALVKVAPEKPTMFMAWAMPGTPNAISSARCCTASVRDSDAPGGNCTTTMM